MISAEVEGRGPFMTYPEPWRGPPKQQPEFLRPQPKPLQINKYNGLNGPPLALNGTRVVHNLSHAAVPKYSPPAAAPVNLTQHQPLKEEMAEELTFAYRPYPTQTFTGYPSQYLYQNHYLNSRFVATPMTPMDQFSPATTPTTGTFLSPTTAYSPPAKPQIIRPERTAQPLSSPLMANQNFKVPSGKEGSLKHRILQTRPEDNVQKCAIDLHKPLSQDVGRRRLPASTGSPPQSPAMKTAFNNNSMSANFAKGCLIQLENGDYKKLEEMKTEDFVMSAEISTDLRLADSTVVKIEENPITGSVRIMLTYNQRRTQTEVEYPLEHPFFVYGKGWASCNPDRTLHSYGLKVHRLQVGDVIISLTPRTQHSTTSQQSATRLDSTHTATATTTAMTVRQVCTMASQQKIPSNHSISHITSSQISPESLAKKRRWSAPSQIDDEDDLDEQPTQRKIKHE